MTDNITPLRGNRPLVSDIPGMLRQLADKFEAGGETAEGILVLIPPTVEDETYWPKLLGFGENWETHYRIAQLELAKLWSINQMTSSTG